MSIDYDALAKVGGIPKPTSSKILRGIRTREEARLWREVCAAVDKRDHRVCQVTRRLLSPGSPDGYRALARHHLAYRSLEPSQIFTVTNVWTVSRAIHEFIHESKILLLDENGEEALDVRRIDHVVWNRERMPDGSEPLEARIRFKKVA